MILEFIPRSQLWQRIGDGWVPAPGWDYDTRAYAILMEAPATVDAPITLGKRNRRRSALHSKKREEASA